MVTKDGNVKRITLFPRFFMAFRHFRILRITDHISVDENVIDKQVCDHFGFAYSAEDYGHFCFTENEAKDIDQKSISWVGLLDLIFEYSFIGSGKKTKYEIEAALAWTLQYVRLPKSTVSFLSELLKFLEQRGYYVYVYGHTNEKEDDIFKNAYKHEMILENSSGLFLCNNEGTLLRFFPSTDNLLDETVVRERYTFEDAYFKPCVHTLIIPEGVNAIGSDFFRGGMVDDEFSFPSTLKSIGSNAFAHAFLPEVEIPENVDTIGAFAFGHCHIENLRFKRIFECEYLRQFKDSHIEKLYLPKECQHQWKRQFDGYAYLHEADDVEFY